MEGESPKGSTLLGRANKRAKLRREAIGGGWVGFCTREGDTVGRIEGYAKGRGGEVEEDWASKAKMIGGIEDEGVTLSKACFFLEAIAREAKKER